MTDILNTSSYAGYLAFLQARLSPPRLAHSIGVMQLMGELASLYGFDKDQALSAGLLHDAAKDLSAEALLALAERANYRFAHPCDRFPIYLHAHMSAFVVCEELGMDDQVVLNAIAVHSWSGEQAMMDTLFARCLRIADILVPVQEWKGMRKLKQMIYDGRIEEATLLQSGFLIEYLREQQIPVHPALEQNFNSPSAQLRVPDSFFERW